MAKTTTVTLTCPSCGDREFEVSHAERLLRMQKNGGWQLKGNDYELKDGFITRRDTKKGK